MPFEAYIGYLKDEDQQTKQEIVAEPPNVLDDAEGLWVLNWVESKVDKPWSIRVLEELDEDAANSTRSDVSEDDRQAQVKESMKFDTRKRASIQLPDMMGQEDARKFYENVVEKPHK